MRCENKAGNQVQTTTDEQRMSQHKRLNIKHTNEQYELQLNLGELAGCFAIRPLGPSP